MIATQTLVQEISRSSERIRENIMHPDWLDAPILIDYVEAGRSDCSGYTTEMGAYVAVYLDTYGLETDIFLQSGQVWFNGGLLKTLPVQLS